MKSNGLAIAKLFQEDYIWLATSFRVDHMPYGGIIESGVGREGIKYAINEMIELKLVILKELIA